MKVVAHDGHAAVERSVGSTARAHRYAVGMDVARADAVNIKQTEQQLKVGRYFILRVKKAIFPVVKIRNHVRIKRKEFEAWLEKRNTERGC